MNFQCQAVTPDTKVGIQEKMMMTQCTLYCNDEVPANRAIILVFQYIEGQTGTQLRGVISWTLDSNYPLSL